MLSAKTHRKDDLPLTSPLQLQQVSSYMIKLDNSGFGTVDEWAVTITRHFSGRFARTSNSHARGARNVSEKGERPIRKISAS